MYLVSYIVLFQMHENSENHYNYYYMTEQS